MVSGHLRWCGASFERHANWLPPFCPKQRTRGVSWRPASPHRGLAFMSYFAGDFPGARLHCEQALATCSSECDLEARERSGEDTRAVAMAMFALASWQLGEVDRARELIEAANRRAAEIGHRPIDGGPTTPEIPSGNHARRRRGRFDRVRGAGGPQPGTRDGAPSNLGRNGVRVGPVAVYTTPKAERSRFQRALGALAEIGGAVDTAFFSGCWRSSRRRPSALRARLARVDEAFALSNQVESRSLSLPSCTASAATSC